jgi:hypothetical protein
MSITVECLNIDVLVLQGEERERLSIVRPRRQEEVGLGRRRTVGTC